MEYFYTYKILFETGEYYIGRRKCPNGVLPQNDKYMGSPKTNKNKWKLQKTKIILNVFNSDKEHVIDEENQLGNKWKTDPLCLNASPANNKSNSGLVWCNDGNRHFMKTLHQIKELGYSIGRLGTSSKGKLYYTNNIESRMFLEGEQPNGWILGNHNSKNKKNASHKYGAPNKGKTAYTNGVSTIYISKYENVPDGYYKGRPDDFKRKRSELVSGKNNPRYGIKGLKWYNNGNINKLFMPGQEENGFIKGMISRDKK